ncbi:LGFP repeat-containing protein [Nocardia sp. NPDC050406]|uniref:LGFP repeat-containing protein n=1 Tax=Nocardia sp. NPDC050406 TaxID=3364318 RepID=UPI00378C52CF
MNHFARRTAGIIAALALVSVIAAGCSDDDKDAKPSDTTTAMATATEHQGDHTTTAAPDTDTDTPDNDPRETRIPTANGDIEVEGAILEKYNAFGGVNGALGEPTGDDADAPDGGKVQEFKGGAIYSSPTAGTHVVWGDIREAYLANGGPGGKLGYPTTDETDIPGGKQSDFTGGTITWINNQTTVTEK